MIIGVDTALQNTAFVTIGFDGIACGSSKPFSKKDERTLERTERIATVVDSFVSLLTHWLPVMVSLEDYLLTGHQKAYETAELLGALKLECFRRRVPYILVHPTKTLKYVVKRKEVPKSEIIQYVQSRNPEVFQKHHVADHSDVADAWVIAQIGRLAWRMLKTGKVVGVSATKDELSHPETQDWEARWVELMLTDGSGILTKPGLCWLPK